MGMWVEVFESQPNFLCTKIGNKKKGKNNMKSSGIGGQAVIEGIMMKNQEQYAVAVRKPDQEIAIDIKNYQGIVKNKMVRNFPIVRGVLSFIDSLVLGMKTLTFSASFYEEDENSKPSKADQALNQLFKEKAEAVVMGATVCFSIVAAVALFMILPYLISDFLAPYVISTKLMALIEGVIRITIFIGYILLISCMKDIRRTFMYHGAEHKCINCIESGLPLTIENVRVSSKQHRRCGTSFLLIVMIISMVFFFFIQTSSPVMRVVIRLLLIPVIAGVSYEFIRFAGNSDSVLVEWLSKPGMWMQKLTTKEPDDSMIEVAIQAVEAVFDWKTWQVEQGYLSKEEADIMRAEEGFEFYETDDQ